MISNLTGLILAAFIHGAIGIIVSGFIIETGDGYTKILGGNQFTNKWAAALLLAATAAFGLVLKHIDPYINEFVHSFPPHFRAGFVVIGSMLLLNYKVSDYNYDDWRSITVYLIGVGLIVYPELELGSVIGRFV